MCFCLSAHRCSGSIVWKSVCVEVLFVRLVSNLAAQVSETDRDRSSLLFFRQRKAVYFWSSFSK